MALTPVKYASIIAILGTASFILGVLAEMKKPPTGEIISGKGVVICKYPSDPSVVLGYLSTVFLAVATIAGYRSLFYPYKGKSIPQSEIFSSSWCTSFLSVSFASSVFAAVFLIWPTVTEHLLHTRNVHTNIEFDCPTAKTGLLGGGAFVSLNACLFWLVSLMLVTNVREDYFEEGAGKHEII